MTQNDKELLRKDLCARLPYGVKVHLSRKHNRPEEDVVLNNVIINKDGVVSNIIGYNYFLSEIKPYLRPMSSMTEEEYKESKSINEWTHLDDGTEVPCMNYIDWLNAHHFDYRGLIPKGLALEAPKEMLHELNLL